MESHRIERVFIISIRKDIDYGLFEFPAAFPLKSRLKDFLEHNVAESLYLNPNNFPNAIIRFPNKSASDTINLGNLYGDYGTGYAGNVWDPNGIAPTIKTVSGGNGVPVVIVKTNNSKGFDVAEEEEDSINFEQPNSKTRRGRVGHGISQTLTTSCNQGILQNNRIRKLSPRECFRLMGFDDSDFEKAENVNSNRQLYKQAGNSIVVDVLEELFCKMLDEDGNIFV